MLESRITRKPARNEPLVLAAFSYRYDAHLVPGLLENLAQAVHGHVAWNDTGAEAALTAETTRRMLILQEARRLGAQWILAADPDERFEDRVSVRMPEMLALGEGNLWMFSLREMFEPDRYRTDGLWGGKQNMRLFPLSAAKGDLTVALHGRWIADSTGYVPRDARINIYHLRMASPVRRRLRRDLYAASDPSRAFQVIGYDYLDDERGIRLEQVPAGRGYSPVFTEDHGTWSPVPEAVGLPIPDALEQRLHFVAQSAARQGHAAAYHVLRDLCAASPQDEDMPLLAASHALTAGLEEEALEILVEILRHRPGDLLAQDLKARASHVHGRADDARRLADFTAADATWRRWVNGPATCREGARTAQTELELTVIVIGFRAGEGLAEAVASLIAQDVRAEIVVVNTGGGDVRRNLARWLDDIRLIEVEEPLYVGAARNIGIDASRAPIVAFLAGDCMAEPGWVDGRLRRHRAGALTVASPVLPETAAGIVAEAANRLLYWGRRPDTPVAYVAAFGRSYHRRLFDIVGPFAPGLRISEDQELNRLVDRIAPPDWAPDVLTRHRDPVTLGQLFRAQIRRGENRADHPPFRAMATAPESARLLADEMRGRLRASRRALAQDQALWPWRRRALYLVQWLANRADRIGTARGLARIAKAASLSGNGDDLAAVQQAAALDPQDWRKALQLATALSKAEDDAAIAEYRRGLALAPGEARLLDGLTRHLNHTHGPVAALAEAERAALSAPLSRAHWDIASRYAASSGRADLALAHARRALALAPNLPEAHRRVGQCHEATGSPVAALFRSHAASRLEADRAARSKPGA